MVYKLGPGQEQRLEAEGYVLKKTPSSARPKNDHANEGVSSFMALISESNQGVSSFMALISEANQGVSSFMVLISEANQGVSSFMVLIPVE
jgi:hypothetical protein